MLRCPTDAGVVAHRSRGPRQTHALLPAATSMTTNGYFFPNGMVSSAASGTAALLLTRDGAPPVRWDPEGGWTTCYSPFCRALGLLWAFPGWDEVKRNSPTSRTRGMTPMPSSPTSAQTRPLLLSIGCSPIRWLVRPKFSLRAGTQLILTFPGNRKDQATPTRFLKRCGFSKGFTSVKHH